jgi:signal transduction histidine kinase
MEVHVRALVGSLVLFLFSQTLFAYDFIENLNPNIEIKQAGFFKAQEDNLIPERVYELYKMGQFMPLPKEAKSFGTGIRDYWFFFEVKKSLGEHYLDLKNSALRECELFSFKRGILYKSQKDGFLDGDDLKIRFELSRSDEPVLYLLKVKTFNPCFIAFTFGNEAQVDASHNNQFLLYAFTSGVFVFVLIFNIFLYLRLKERTYFWYILHMFGLYMSIVVVLGYTKPLAVLTPYIVVVSFVLQIIGLVLFSDSFLNIKELYPKGRKFLFRLLYIQLFIAALALVIKQLHPLLFMFALIIFSTLCYLGIKAKVLGSQFADYYLIATGMFLVFAIAYTLAHNGILRYTFISFNLLQFALIWDGLFIMLAVVYKIYLLHEGNVQKEKIIKLRVRQDTIGSIMGNIAHQWRAPLAEVGALVTSLRAQMMHSEIEKKSILEYLAKISKALKHLSGTVDTFQNLTKHEHHKIDFNLSQRLHESIDLLANTLKGIDMDVMIEEDIMLHDKPNAFIQVFLGIIENAQEALLESDTADKRITISLKSVSNKVVLTIADNGKMVTCKDTNELFEPFYTTKEKGSGLGLFLAKTIIEHNYNGTIKCEIDGRLKRFVIVI